MPSVLGDLGLAIVTPVTVTFSQNSGFTVQKGELMMVIPSTKTFLQNMGCMNGGRRNPRSNVDGSSGLMAFLLFLANSSCHLVLSVLALSMSLYSIAHHFCPWPLIVPLPVMVM